MRVPSGREISDIFYPYVAVPSESGTPREKSAAEFVRSRVSRSPYFLRHPDHFGSAALPDDPLGRTVEWALVKGRGERTVVLIHHFDVVDVEDYGSLGALAFDPEGLAGALKEAASSLDDESRADLESGAYLFGRGTADMKAGGAVQMALLAAAAEDPEFQGNLLLLALPDEENLSAGMRRALDLLAELKERFELRFVLMLNSEPHQRKDPDTVVLSGGSIGKILPFVYVRGILSHAGKSPEGFNPLAVLSEIVRRTEMSPELADALEDSPEMSPPPTWLMARDSKEAYDVSMPLSAFGILSVQPLSNRPERVLEAMRSACEGAASAAAADVNSSAELFRLRTGRLAGGRVWEPRVLSLGELSQGLKAEKGRAFESAREEAADRVRGGAPLFRTAWSFVDALAEMAGSTQPLVITGFLPPYYPSVSYRDRPEFAAAVRPLAERLSCFSRERWGQTCELESYFTGISDLSYSSVADAAGVERLMRSEMPFFGDAYTIPFERIASLSVPCLNIGPWGKDFHKRTERVLREDLEIRTPALLAEAVKLALAPPGGSAS